MLIFRKEMLVCCHFIAILCVHPFSVCPPYHSSSSKIGGTRFDDEYRSVEAVGK